MNSRGDDFFIYIMPNHKNKYCNISNQLLYLLKFLNIADVFHQLKEVLFYYYFVELLLLLYTELYKRLLLHQIRHTFNFSTFLTWNFNYHLYRMNQLNEQACAFIFSDTQLLLFYFLLSGTILFLSYFPSTFFGFIFSEDVSFTPKNCFTIISGKPLELCISNLRQSINLKLTG